MTDDPAMFDGGGGPESGGEDGEHDREPELPAAPRHQIERRDLLQILGAAAVTTGAASTTGSAYRPPRTLETRLAATGEGRTAAAVALDAGTAVVGAPPATETERSSEATRPRTGALAVFTRDGDSWSRQARLTPESDALGGRFGSAVAVDDTTAVVGAPLPGGPHRPPRGTATVFGRSDGAWRREATLETGESAIDRFGSAVAVDGETVLVGAPSAGGPTGDGRASLFERVDGAWQQVATLTPPPAVEAFGRAVGLTDDLAVVGGRRTGGETCGIALVFERSDGRWRRVAELTAARDDCIDGFGTTLSVDRWMVLVGAPTETNGDGVDAGAAYVFDRRGDGPGQMARLRPPGGTDGRRFGASVALDGPTALVGSAVGSSPSVFTRVGLDWSPLRTLSDWGRPAGVAGSDVALAGSRALVGFEGEQRDERGDVAVFDS
jgi:hypothetical protein